MNNKPYSILSVLIHSAEQWSDRPALVDEHGALDYRSLLAEVEKTALMLRSFGLKEGDGVGVQGPNSRGFVIAVFAAVRCGATVLPIAHTLMPAEREEILNRTPVHVMITDKSSAGNISSAGKEVVMSGESSFLYYETGRSRHEKIVNYVQDAAFVRYTSGTTGQAKGVVLSHQGVYERITAANRGLHLNQDDSVLFVLPMAFHFYVSIILYLHAGAAIVIAKEHSPASLAELIDKHQVTLFYASPYHYRMLGSAGLAKEKLQSLKCAISTSTGLSEDIAEKFLSVFGLPITQAYGIIEVGLPIINVQGNAYNPQAIGQPLPDYEVAILDDAGAILPPGTMGNLAMRGPGMFAAYLDPFQTREEVLVNGWFMTGDIASQGKDGSVTVRGRQKSMINVCGEKVFPEEVENVLSEHDKVVDAHAFGAAHLRMGETVHAQVVLAADAFLTSEELIGYARTRLSPFKIPQQIFFVKKIEKTSSGKALRRSE